MKRGTALAVVYVAGFAPAAHAAATDPVLSAYFGLDDALPAQALLACPLAPRQDGMPVVLREEVDVDTVAPDDFTVVTRSGRRLRPACATTVPAEQNNENRTVLLLGELGNAASDPAERVIVDGPLRDKSGASIQGASVAVTPFGAGETIVYAEPVFREDTSNVLPARGGQLPFVGAMQQNTPCPAATVQSVRVTWTGGTSAPGGGDEGDAQRRGYRVVLEDAAGNIRQVVPDALADLGDMDNNTILCLFEHGRPLAVSDTAGAVVSPGGFPNPATEAPITIDPLDTAAGIVATDPDATLAVPAQAPATPIVAARLRLVLRRLPRHRLAVALSGGASSVLAVSYRIGRHSSRGGSPPRFAAVLRLDGLRRGRHLVIARVRLRGGSTVALSAGLRLP